VIQPVHGPDGPAEGEVAGEDDVLPLQGDEHRPLHGPRADPGDGRQLGEDLVVGQAAQPVCVQPAVGEPLRQVAQRADLPPGTIAPLTGVAVSPTRKAMRSAIACGAARAPELAQSTLAEGESYADLLADRSAFEEFYADAARGAGAVRLAQLAVEHLLGAR
jgi:hypothetical protein